MPLWLLLCRTLTFLSFSFSQLLPCRPTTRRLLWTRPTAQSLCCWNLPRAEAHLWGRLPRQRELLKVFLRPKGNIDRRGEKTPKSKSLCLSIPDRKGMLPENSAPCCLCLIFRALFVCLVWSCVEEAEEPLKMRSQNRLQPWLASGFLFFTRLFMCRAAHHEHRQLLGDWGIGFFFPCCLISHLWGKSRVLLKCQVVGQRLSVCFTRRHCRLLAAYLFIFCCYLWSRQPFRAQTPVVSESPAEVSSFCHHNLLLWPRLLFFIAREQQSVLWHKIEDKNWINGIIEE